MKKYPTQKPYSKLSPQIWSNRCNRLLTIPVSFFPNSYPSKSLKFLRCTGKLNELFESNKPVLTIFVSSLETGKILKKLNDLVSQKNKELESFMTAMRLDIVNNKKLTDLDQIPEKLLECCASINIRQNLVDDMPKLMKNLIDVSFTTKDSIEDLDELVQQAEAFNDIMVRVKLSASASLLMFDSVAFLTAERENWES
jgi:hypothetical protein